MVILARQRVFAWLLAALILVVVLELVRRRRLDEEFSWPWLGAAVGVILLVLVPRILESISRLLGITEPANVAFVLAIVFLLGQTLQLSVHVSRLRRHVKDLTQQVAILTSELDAVLEQNNTASPPERDTDAPTRAGSLSE